MGGCWMELNMETIWLFMNSYTLVLLVGCIWIQFMSWLSSYLYLKNTQDGNCLSYSYWLLVKAQNQVYRCVTIWTWGCGRFNTLIMVPDLHKTNNLNLASLINLIIDVMSGLLCTYLLVTRKIKCGNPVSCCSAHVMVVATLCHHCHHFESGAV